MFKNCSFSWSMFLETTQYVSTTHMSHSHSHWLLQQQVFPPDCGWTPMFRNAYLRLALGKKLDAIVKWCAHTTSCKTWQDLQMFTHEVPALSFQKLQSNLCSTYVCSTWPNSAVLVVQIRITLLVKLHLNVSISFWRMLAICCVKTFTHLSIDWLSSRKSHRRRCLRKKSSRRRMRAAC